MISEDKGVAAGQAKPADGPITSLKPEGDGCSAQQSVCDQDGTGRGRGRGRERDLSANFR